jgi:putative oxidoreductase
MMLARRVARPMLASIFIYGGLEAFLNPGSKVPKADKLISGLPERIPIPYITSTEQLVRIDGAAKVIGGIALGFGRTPRFAALALAASLAPTTLAGHAFWDENDRPTRQAQKLQLAKNASIMGGLLLAAVDTGGKPSLGWRAKRATRRLGKKAKAQQQSAASRVYERTS